MLPRYLVTLLPCYLDLVTTLACYHVTLLPHYLVTTLPCAVSSWNYSDHHGNLSAFFSFPSLSSDGFIPCISSIHLLRGHPLHLLPSPHASIIPFSNPSDRITCPLSKESYRILYTSILYPVYLY